MSEPQARNSNPVRITLWPALTIAIVHAAGLTLALAFVHTFFLFAVIALFVPMVLLIGLAVWWMLSRSVPLAQRFGGLAMVALFLALIAIRNPMLDGGFSLLILVLATLNIGIPCVLLVTQRQSWLLRRLMLILFLCAAAVGFSAVRVDGSQSNEMPILAWRWSPTPEAITQASFDAAPEPQRVAAIPQNVGSGDWPGFRGANRDGRAAGVAFSTDWDSNPPVEQWRRRIGLGWSSFTVAGDYLFTQEQRGADELVVCYEAATGDQVWTNSLPVRFEEAHGDGPRATPTFHEGMLYVQGAMGALQCLDASTGEVRWKRELTEDAGVEVPMWGFASSPLIVDGRVIVFAGGEDGKSVWAYDKKTGDTVWNAGDANHSYASVHYFDCDGTPQILVPSNAGIQSLDPATGDELWAFTKSTRIDEPSCIQPLLPESNVVLFSSELQGTRRLRLSQSDAAWQVEEEWTAKKFRPAFNDMIYHDGHAYGFDGRLLVCFDTSTGERKWKGKRFGGQVLHLPDMNAILVLSQKGEVVLVETTAESYKELARFKALEGKTWNHPVIANGHLFVRNSEEAACFRLPA